MEPLGREKKRFKAVFPNANLRKGVDTSYLNVQDYKLIYSKHGKLPIFAFMDVVILVFCYLRDRMSIEDG